MGLKDRPTRYRDFTPTRSSPDSGGADRYLQFLKEELALLIDKKFRTGSERSALVGGSMGGLFLIHALLNEPTLFKSYVPLDPSLWWDGGVVNTEFQRKVGTLKSLNRVLWINGREGEGMREMGIDRLEAILRARAPSGLTWNVPPLCQWDSPHHLGQGVLGRGQVLLQAILHHWNWIQAYEWHSAERDAGQSPIGRVPTRLGICECGYACKYRDNRHDLHEHSFS